MQEYLGLYGALMNKYIYISYAGSPRDQKNYQRFVNYLTSELGEGVVESGGDTQRLLEAASLVVLYSPPWLKAELDTKELDIYRGHHGDNARIWFLRWDSGKQNFNWAQRLEQRRRERALSWGATYPGHYHDSEFGQRKTLSSREPLYQAQLSELIRYLICALEDRSFYPPSISEDDFQKLEKPAWATELGFDDYGAYAFAELNSVEIVMRYIPSGEYIMGNTSGLSWIPNTSPIKVTIDSAFWMADTVCSQRLWQAFANENPSTTANENYPVDNISWQMAKSFIEALNKYNPSLQADLPTEEEWEYACRAGDDRDWYGAGAKIKACYELIDRKYEPDMLESAKELSTTNHWGLIDMLGPIAQWCKDASTKRPVQQSYGCELPDWFDFDPQHQDYAALRNTIERHDHRWVLASHSSCAFRKIEREEENYPNRKRFWGFRFVFRG